jgi:hypothetical protein
MRRRTTMVLVALTTVATGVVLAADPPVGSQVVGLPLTREEALSFLRSAEVVDQPENFDSKAITDPVRLTASDGTHTLRAIFKDENTLYPRFRFGDGREVDRVRDSYKHEIAAFELDTMLGLGLVPPCVERTLFSHTGALCLWVENAITEAERGRRGLHPPDVEQWNRRMILVRFFHQLILDLDFANIRNLLVDENFRIYKVDSSMAFHVDRELRRENSLTRFSRAALTALESLERSELEERLGPWLLRRELDALWARRNRLLELARENVARHGEAEVLY